MSYREWNNLPNTKQYTITAMNGWILVMNNDGTVTLKHGGNASPAATTSATSMTINPDPGAGDVPPGK